MAGPVRSADESGFGLGCVETLLVLAYDALERTAPTCGQILDPDRHITVPVHDSCDLFAQVLQLTATPNAHAKLLGLL